MTATTPVRFWSRVDTSAGLFACWPWTGSRTERGYGKVSVNGRDIRANRAAWEYTNGPIPAGMNVLHECDNPPCCNPVHLHLGTILDNNREMIARGRYVPHVPPPRSHCVNGHELSPENTLWRVPGRVRRCRTCRIAQNTAYRHRVAGTGLPEPRTGEPPPSVLGPNPPTPRAGVVSAIPVVVPPRLLRRPATALEEAARPAATTGTPTGVADASQRVPGSAHDGALARAEGESGTVGVPVFYGRPTRPQPGGQPAPARRAHSQAVVAVPPRPRSGGGRPCAASRPLESRSVAEEPTAPAGRRLGHRRPAHLGNG